MFYLIKAYFVNWTFKICTEYLSAIKTASAKQHFKPVIQFFPTWVRNALPKFHHIQYVLYLRTKKVHFSRNISFIYMQHLTLG